ncbi:hypothetical protein QR685DRAFT_438841 [Neurospora intermedia]|uniref:Myb-like domain-containing protein n=1 Tax=Neurospora intermedia TaxID=5142 RepID=A0ABR3DGZ5_NEUIN
MPPAMAPPTINDHDAQNDAESHHGSAIDDADFDYAQLDGIPRRRHQVESAGSEYEPPSDEDVDLEKTKRGRSRSRSKSILTPRPPKRSSDGLALHTERPPKRHKTPFNHSYLALLNADIIDAASRFVPTGDETTQQLAPSQIGLTLWTPAEKELFFSAVSRLGPDSASAIASRIRTKSELEVAEYLEVFRQTIKTRQDPKLATPAQLLQPVTPAEVSAAVELSQQCCNALEEAADAVASRQESWEEAEEMRKWGENRWLIRKDNVKGLEMEAREEREKETEAREEREKETERKQREEKGKGKDVNQDGDYETVVKTEEDIDEFGRRKLPALDLFRVRKMLDLSENVFMNSTVDDYNWSSMSDESPAIRATALEDLHSLVVSLTRRLVAAVIYISESHIKAKRAVHPLTRNHVWRQDVEAAVLSLGLKKDSHQFWTKAARRLRLDVYGDEDDDYKEELARKEEEGIDVDVEMIRDEPEPMSYAEVEETLGLEPDTNHPESDDADEPDEDEQSDVESLASLSSTPSLDELDNLEQNAEEPTQTELDQITPSSPAPSEHHQLDPVEDEAIKAEAKELLRYSALPMAITSRARQVLYSRIRTQRAQEAYADALDMRASYKEEKRMWQLLEREPPEDLVLVKGEIPQQPVATGRHTGVDELLGTRGVEVGAWREKVEEGFGGAEWEVEWQRHLEDAKERGR